MNHTAELPKGLPNRGMCVCPSCATWGTLRADGYAPHIAGIDPNTYTCTDCGYAWRQAKHTSVRVTESGAVLPPAPGGGHYLTQTAPGRQAKRKAERKRRAEKRMRIRQERLRLSTRCRTMMCMCGGRLRLTPDKQQTSVHCVACGAVLRQEDARQEASNEDRT